MVDTITTDEVYVETLVLVSGAGVLTEVCVAVEIEVLVTVISDGETVVWVTVVD